MSVRNLRGQILVHDVLHIAGEHLQTQRRRTAMGGKPALQDFLFHLVGHRVIVQFAHENDMGGFHGRGYVLPAGGCTVAAVDPVVLRFHIVGRGQLCGRIGCRGKKEDGQCGQQRKTLYGNWHRKKEMNVRPGSRNAGDQRRRLWSRPRSLRPLCSS